MYLLGAGAHIEISPTPKWSKNLSIVSFRPEVALDGLSKVM